MTAEYSEDDVLGGLDSEPRPAKPAPLVNQLAAAGRMHGLLELVAVAVAAALLAAVGTALWLGPRGDAPAPSPPKPSAEALGRSYAPKLVEALAAAFDADADALKAGKTFGQANQALKATFHEANARAFEAHAGQALTDLIAEGTPIKDQAQRDALERFHRDFARGLREAR